MSTQRAPKTGSRASNGAFIGMVVLLLALIAGLSWAVLRTRTTIEPNAVVQAAQGRPPCKTCGGRRPDFVELAALSQPANDARRVFFELEYQDQAWSPEAIAELASIIDDPMRHFPEIADDESRLLSSMGVRMLGRRLAREDSRDPRDRVVGVLDALLDHPDGVIRFNAIQALVDAGAKTPDGISRARLDSAMVGIEEYIGRTLTQGLRQRVVVLHLAE